MFTVELEVEERPPPGPHAGAGGGPTWGCALCMQSQGAQSPGGGGAEGPGLARATCLLTPDACAGCVVSVWR